MVVRIISIIVLTTTIIICMQDFVLFLWDEAGHCVVGRTSSKATGEHIVGF